MGASVYASANTLMVDHIRNLLAERGIDATVRGRHLSGIIGEIPPAEAWPEVWVLDDERLDEARAVVEEALGEQAPHRQQWTCSRCGETLDGQFTDCWKCGRATETDDAPTEGDALYHEVSAQARAGKWTPWILFAVLAVGVLWMLISYSRSPW